MGPPHAPYKDKRTSKNIPDSATLLLKQEIMVRDIASESRGEVTLELQCPVRFMRPGLDEGQKYYQGAFSCAARISSLTF